jgi:glycosyltransferase involved in cell wall biosynthesis
MEKVTVIIPIYNEERRLENAINRIKKAGASMGLDIHVLIVEDGSEDNSRIVCEKLIDKEVRLISNPKRVGRGKSINDAIRSVETDIIVFMDVDLSTNLEDLPSLIREIEKGAAIATGSRLLPNSRVMRDFTRDFFSKSYNLLVRLLTGSNIQDHQCGFKAFSREKIMQILDEVEDNHWFWDTELLVRAQRKGMKISEIPVEWKGTKESKVNLIHDVIDMGYKLLRLSLSS